jgi:hypothetical protein
MLLIAMAPTAAFAAMMCGDSNGDGRVSTSDALGILRYSAGLRATCVPPVCDANSNGAVTVTDALIVLNVSVGRDAEAQCPAERGVVLGDTQVIDLEALMPGQRIESINSADGVGPVGVVGFNPNANFDESLNAAIVFDSTCPEGCTGGDTDLGSPNGDFGGPGVGDGGRQGREFANSAPRGNIAIIAENLVDRDGDGLIDDPDDQGAGPVTLEFDFSAVGPVSVLGITIIDVELTEIMPLVELLDADGAVVASQSLANTGNNGVGVTVLEPNTGVMGMRISANGSIGFDDILFAQELLASTTTTAPTTTTSTTSTTLASTTTSSTTTSTTSSTTSTTTSTTMEETTTTTLGEG